MEHEMLNQIYKHKRVHVNCILFNHELFMQSVLTDLSNVL